MNEDHCIQLNYEHALKVFSHPESQNIGIHILWFSAQYSIHYMVESTMSTSLVHIKHIKSKAPSLQRNRWDRTPILEVFQSGKPGIPISYLCDLYSNN